MTAPAWLNLDVFDYPPDALEEVRTMADEVAVVVTQARVLGERAAALLDRMNEVTHERGEGLPDGMWGLLDELNGLRRLQDMFAALQVVADAFGHGYVTELGEKRLREEYPDLFAD